MNKTLFIDRDGTLLEEPEDRQIDSLEKLQLLPYVIGTLIEAVALGYTLVMVSNQDGLGTPSFPEHTFIPAHEKLLKLLAGEGILFDALFIDRTFLHENKPTRKPGTAMLQEYLTTREISLDKSFTIGDRWNDVKLARNLGCRSIFIGPVSEGLVKGGNEAEAGTEPPPDFSVGSWLEIRQILRAEHTRKASIVRSTAETNIRLNINLDGTGVHQITTGLAFYDHMIDQLSRHSEIDIDLTVEGDLTIDEHHTIEDSAIALGTAVRTALGDKVGIERYAFVLPMDEAQVSCTLDFSGRAWCIFEGQFDREYVGDFPTEMLSHWMHSFAEHAGLTMHMKVSGENTHHKVEACFKALARCLRQAVRVTSSLLPSTKGTLA